MTRFNEIPLDGKRLMLRSHAATVYPFLHFPGAVLWLRHSGTSRMGLCGTISFLEILLDQGKK